ncbi:MAG: SPOR domain-containing protein [Ignavibacteria bacterium]|nr:SPOR domain-containing protein [Ignavibacteria bacterium]
MKTFHTEKIFSGINGKKMFKKIIFINFSLTLLLTILFLYSCAVPEEYTEYIYDTVKVKKADTIKISVKDTSEKKEYITYNIYVTVQLGAFSNRSNAEAFAQKAKEILNTDIEIDYYKEKYTVIVGTFESVKRAEGYLNYVKSQGFTEAFIRSRQ